MNTVEVNVSDVLSLHTGAKRNGKKVLELLVPKLFLKEMKERVKSFEDACGVLEIPVNNNLSAYEKLKIIIKCFNLNWIADYGNQNQRKFYPYFRYTAGSGFALNAVHCERTFTYVGAPFVFEHEADARYVATQFKSLYNEMYSLEAKPVGFQMDKLIGQHIADYKLACNKLNISPVLPDVSNLPIGMQNYILSKIMIPVLIAVDRGNWVPDYDNSDQYKYYPWWDMEKRTTAGSGFALSAVYCEYADAYVGAPFVFESETKCRSFVKKYIDLYRFIMKGIEF